MCCSVAGCKCVAQCRSIRVTSNVPKAPRFFVGALVDGVRHEWLHVGD